MSTSNNFSDIDISLLPNIRNDFSIIQGIQNCVRNNLQNILLISSYEIPFDNSLKPSIDNVIHSNDEATKNMQIQDVVEYVALQDKRIDSIESIKLTTNNETEIIIALTVKLVNLKDDVTFNIRISKI